MSTVTFNIGPNGSVVAHHEGESTNSALKVGTEVVDNGGVMTGFITAVDNPALGPEFGPTKYTIDWYFSPGWQDGPSFTKSGETADRFNVVIPE
tara:strand:+ start:77 stop:358 length:282 start_codon:yes stop_codon:yes gene_type:complete